MTYVGGFETKTIPDSRGTTDNTVAGSYNNVRYVGDHGANTFRVGGMRNNVEINNIGRDENIQLEGRPQDWQQMPDCNPHDGKVTMLNTVTGNTVTMKTDAGRNDCFVKSKISFTGNYASLGNPCACACAGFGGWNNLGNMAMNPGCFDPSSYMAGYYAGQQNGYQRGVGDGYQYGRSSGFSSGAFWGSFAAWGAMSLLQPRAWSRGCF